MSNYTEREKLITSLIAKRRKRAATLTLLRFAIVLPFTLPFFITLMFGKACELIVDWIENCEIATAILNWSSYWHDEAIRKNNRVLRLARKQYQRRTAIQFERKIKTP